MADIKVKSGFNRAETGGVVDLDAIIAAVKASILGDAEFLEDLGGDNALRTELEDYFDTLYTPL